MELKERIIKALKEVYDPEIPVNVYDLGFIYSIDEGEGDVKIDMTLTVPGCPMHQVITRQVEEAVRAVEGVKDVNVKLTFEPRWSVEKISEDGKSILREMGYDI